MLSSRIHYNLRRYQYDVKLDTWSATSIHYIHSFELDVEILAELYEMQCCLETAWISIPVVMMLLDFILILKINLFDLHFVNITLCMYNCISRWTRIPSKINNKNEFIFSSKLLLFFPWIIIQWPFDSECRQTFINSLSY